LFFLNAKHSAWKNCCAFPMSSATLIFPHQLFKAHPALDKIRTVYLVEEWLFFRQYKFHKQKLVLHRASMQFYAQWLKENSYELKQPKQKMMYAS